MVSFRSQSPNAMSRRRFTRPVLDAGASIEVMARWGNLKTPRDTTEAGGSRCKVRAPCRPLPRHVPLYRTVSWMPSHFTALKIVTSLSGHVTTRKTQMNTVGFLRRKVGTMRQTPCPRSAKACQLWSVGNQGAATVHQNQEQTNQINTSQ